MDYVRLFTLLIVVTVNLGLALAVLARNRRSSANRSFAAAVVALVLWLTAAFLSDQAVLRESALFLNRVTFGCAVAMGGFLLYFVRLFPKPDRSFERLARAFFGLAILTSGLTIFTPLVITDVKYNDWGTDVVSGPLWPVMVAVVVVGWVMLVALSISKAHRAEGRERAQLKFVFLGFVLFASVSSFFGLVLPMITGSYRVSELNTFATLFLVGFTAYAMTKHRFMDVRLVVMRSVAYTLLVFGLGVVFALVATAARAQLVSELGISSDVVFVATCLLAVFAFQPLRVALEHYTDTLFYRKTYDPQQLVTALGRAMTSTLDLDALANVLATELSKGMRLEYAAVGYTRAETVEVVSTGREFSTEETQRLLLAAYAGKIVYADEVGTDPIATALVAESNVRVLVPLASDGVVIAVILLGAKLSGEMFTSNDASFLHVLSDEASIAVKNAHLFDERNQRVRELSALNTMSSALGRDMQLDSVLERALRQVMKVTHAESGSIMLLDKETQTLTIKAADGLPADVIAGTCTRIGEGIAGWVAQHRKALVLGDAVESGFGSELAREGVRSALCVPLVRKGDVIGVLNISRRSSAEGFSRENLKVVTAFAGQLAVAIENARLYEDLENTFLGTIGALAAAVDAKDPYTFGHSSDVTQYALATAAELRISDAETERLRIAALLHDIGKIGIDTAILNKPGALTAEEYEIIKSHPDIAANILGTLEFLADVVPLVQHHHEYYGGGGYPAGISGEAIPLGARIIAVADAFNAMTSDRPYRAALDPQVAIDELRKHAGTQFDPAVVEAFMRVRVRTAQPDFELKVETAPAPKIPGVAVRAV